MKDVNLIWVKTLLSLQLSIEIKILQPINGHFNWLFYILFLDSKKGSNKNAASVIASDSFKNKQNKSNSHKAERNLILITINIFLIFIRLKFKWNICIITIYTYIYISSINYIYNN